ncbi:MAG: hypothetical protein NT166_28550 [Candidatus Aminicenantes bacterium]|nr:hypothetical protein [Candidatus Aminicenantes bacterium]
MKVPYSEEIDNNAAGATQDTAPGNCVDLPGGCMVCAASYDSALGSK